MTFYVPTTLSLYSTLCTALPLSLRYSGRVAQLLASLTIGMFSRLYTNLLNRHYYIDSALANHHVYKGSSLFTISASVIEARHYSDLVKAVLGEVERVEEVGVEEVERAKKMLLSMLYHLYLGNVFVDVRINPLSFMIYLP